MTSTLVLLVLCLFATVGSFSPTATTSRSSTTLFGGGRGAATSPAGKRARVSFVQDKLSSSQMIFSVPSEKITVSQSEQLRANVPEGTTVSLIKNTLMNRAIKSSDEWQEAESLLKGTNLWFFIEEDIKGTLEAFNKFVKTEGLKESTIVRGGVLEGTMYDSAGVAKIGELPSKKELIAKIAGGINMVPTKLARVVAAPNTKLARAIKLAGETKEQT